MNRCQMIRGFPFPNMPWFKKENIEKSMDYIPKNGDIVIASYPKTGMDLLQYIVLQITSKGEFFPSFSNTYHTIGPMMEFTEPEVIENMKGLRIYKHHFRYDMVQKNPKSKVLYIYRNPEDTFISLYHFLKNCRGEPMNLDDFFEEFITGNVEYGNYFDHVLSYLAHKDDENLLLISYERLLANRREEILRIAKFLSGEFYQSLSDNESILEKILEHTSFDYMEKKRVVAIPQSPECFIDFFMKGTVGDGKNILPCDQLKRLQKRVSETMRGKEILMEWGHE